MGDPPNEPMSEYYCHACGTEIPEDEVDPVWREEQWAPRAEGIYCSGCQHFLDKDD